MTIETTVRLATVQRILYAADHDIAEFLAFFTETTAFRMGSGEEVIGKEAVTQWVGGYLGAVTGTTHDVLKVWESADAVAVRMDVTYRMRNGQSITVPAITVATSSPTI